VRSPRHDGAPTPSPQAIGAFRRAPAEQLGAAKPPNSKGKGAKAAKSPEAQDGSEAATPAAGAHAAVAPLRYRTLLLQPPHQLQEELLAALSGRDLKSIGQSVRRGPEGTGEG
jgi:hypothetical protein